MMKQTLMNVALQKFEVLFNMHQNSTHWAKKSIFTHSFETIFLCGEFSLFCENCVEIKF
jgi:hypothetical protein